MNLLQKIRENLTRFMAGRYGVDQLGFAGVIAALVVSVIGSVSRVWVLTLVSDAILLVMLWRMLSKDRYKRMDENRIYLQKTENVRRAVSESINRAKNSKKYRYFVCPKCKARLRVPRGVGSVTITCKSCGTKFDKKA